MNLTRCKPLLGTYVEISVESELEFDELAQLSNLGFSAIEEIQAIMSFHDETSELSKINRKAFIQRVPVTNHLQKILLFCITLSEQTEGMFDVSIAPHLIKKGLLPKPASQQVHTGTWADIHLSKGQITFNRPLLIDLGGVAKGYAIDYALSVMQQFDADAFITINAGGDLVTNHWKNQSVLIPAQSKNTIPQKIKMLNQAIATSSYRYVEKSHQGHIINPRSGESHPIDGSISVFAPCCMSADALTKVALLGGDESIFPFYQAIIHNTSFLNHE